MNWALSLPRVTEQRRQVLAPAYGRTLEIGFGTGLNLPCYPAEVSHLTAIDSNPGMLRWLKSRTRDTDFPVDFQVLNGERLPFQPNSFDCVVSTWTLCSIENVDRALVEMKRVLKPDGRFLFVEHGMSREVGVRKWQKYLTPLQRRLAGGCCLDRPIRELIRKAGFDLVEMEEFYLKGTPRFMGYTYRGVASAKQGNQEGEEVAA